MAFDFKLVPCYRSVVVNSLPNLLCLDDEDITNKERGVAKDVVKLSSSNTGEHFSHITAKKKSYLVTWASRFDEFSYVGNEACYH